MKKLYTNLSIGILFLISITASAQVLIAEDFEGTSGTTMPPGWVFSSSPPFESTTVTPCEGARSVRTVISSANQNATLRSPIQTATGDDIEVSFQYKLINESGGGATPTTFGELQLQYSVNPSATPPTWTTYHTIGSTEHNPSTSCTTYTTTIPAASVPVGSDFAWRIRTNWALGSYYLYIDDFMAVEQVDCIAPLNLSVANITMDSAQISWEDLNTSATWEIEYGPTGFTPWTGLPFPFGGTVVATSASPTTITGLDDGELYDVYVRAICGPGDVSAGGGPLTFQTIAIGSDCANAFDINNDTSNPVQGDLPFTHTSHTNIYGNDYSGAPGNFCNTSANYLQGDDVVYKYVSYDDDILQIEVSGTTGDVGVFVYTSCANIGNTCFDGETNIQGGSTVNIVDLFVTAGQTYYIVISTLGDGTSTPYTLNITGFNCATWEAPSSPPNGIPVDFYNQTLGDFDGTGIGVNPTITGAFLTWYEDDNGAPGAEITNTAAITLQDNDVYWVKQTIGSCDSPFLEVKFEEFDCLGQLAIHTKDESDSVCDSGRVTIGATGNTPNLLWYDDEFGGEVVGSGNSFTTPVITQTTSYWVSEVFFGEGTSHNQGKPGPTASQSYTLNNAGVRFEVSSPMRLVSVQVFSTGPGGTITVALRNESTGTDVERMVNVPSGSTANPVPTMLHLNFNIAPGTYRLIKTSGTGPSMMGSSTATSNFPYPIGNAGEITSGASGTTTTPGIYYYFYNWTIRESEALCESPRQEVIATVHETLPIDVSASDYSVCVGNTTTLTATSPDPDYNYTWSWTAPNGQNQTATGAQTTVTIVQNTTYTVKGVNPNTGCEDEATISIEAIGAGDIPVTPQNIALCIGDTIEINAGGVYHTFNEALTGWTITNTSTAAAGIDPNVARWKLVNSPHNPLDGVASNDNSQFYVAVSDYLGPGGQVNTQLTSPSFNLVGVASASLKFFHHYNHLTTKATQARVEVSVNNGPWQQIQQWTTTQGEPTNFTEATLSLAAYTGNSNVRVRFNYTGGWGWWWAIDNVTITRDYINGEVTWTGTEMQYLFVNEDATVPYTGTATNKIYFSSMAPGTYTYDVELHIPGCGAPVTNTVNIVVNETQAPTGPAIQTYQVGQRLSHLDVTGQNLKYYIMVDGNLTQVSLNTVLVHGTTYYISQTQNNCESDFLEVTVDLECPAPFNIEVTDRAVGSDGESASILIKWSEPTNTSAVQSYKVEIVPLAGGAPVHESTVDKGLNFKVVQNLPLDEEFMLNMYSICDPSIPVYSLVESEVFDTKNMSTGDLNFNGFTYYPNPTRDMVTFENLLPMEHLEVYTINGQKVFEQHTINTTRVQVNFSEFASGVYFAKVKVGEAIQIVRIIRE